MVSTHTHVVGHWTTNPLWTFLVDVLDRVLRFLPILPLYEAYQLAVGVLLNGINRNDIVLPALSIWRSPFFIVNVHIVTISRSSQRGSRPLSLAGCRSARSANCGCAATFGGA